MATPKSNFVISAENRASSVLKTVEKDFGGLGIAARSTGVAFKAFAVTAAAALTSAFSLAAMRATITRMDELSKSAQRANMSAEGFSKLAYAGSLADVSVQDLQTSMGRLARAQDDAQRGVGEQVRAFERLGISYRNADGSLRDTSEVFADFADKFQEFKGSPEIIALGMQLFGRSFQNLIPLLKDGSAGLKAAGQEAELFGVVLSTRAGQSAEAFNDNLTRLGTQVRGFAQIVVSEALDPVVQFTDELVNIGSEALNAKGGIRDLANDGTLKEWAQNAAIAVAVVGESLVFMGKAASTVAGSFSAVWADIEVASAASRNMFGGFLFESNRKALADALASRNKTVEAANAKLLELVNYDGARLSNALREQFAKPTQYPLATFSDARFEAARNQRKPPQTQPPLQAPKPVRFEQAALTPQQSAVIEAAKSYDAASRAAETFALKLQVLDAMFFEQGGNLEDYDAAVRSLTKASETAGQDGVSALRNFADGWLDTIDPMRDFVRQIELVEGALALGFMSPAQAKEIKDRLAEALRPLSQADEFALQAARNIQSALGDTVYDFLDGRFEDIGKSFGNMLKRMAAEAIAADLGRTLLGDFAKSGKVGGLLGPVANWFGGFFGGGRASGGPVSGRMLYEVGEMDRPELLSAGGKNYLIPGNDGRVTPMSGGVTITQNITVSGGASRGEVVTAMRVAKDSAKREILESMRRGGAFA